LYCIKNH